ncbi:MAG: NAD(+) diphosphatase [Steroidobacteraceae bacterium]|jgi:NAD+ diphosphatase|nr:NAD(+) diphosphatase [Steroidobacteraceae bacterium]
MPNSSHATPWNFLAGPYIDRRAEAREQEGWWEEARGDPRTRYVLARGTAQLVVAGPQPGVAFLDGGHPLVQRAARESTLLLGWYRESRCVLVELDEREAPDGDDPAALVGLPGARFEELRPLAPLLEETEASLLAYARALSFWRRRHRYCGVCGARNLPVRAGHVMRCTDERCATEVFPRIDPAIIVLVTDGERALLGRQASWPPGRYSTIAGFVEPGESLEDAVAREVLEETGVQVLGTEYHSSQPWPFPSSLMLGFMASASPDARPQRSSELEDARWFTREEVASGTPMLPPRTSISFRLVEHWFDSAGGFPPLREIPGVGRWEGRR